MTIASYIMILQIDLLHSSVFGYKLLLYIGEIYLKGDEHFDLQVQRPRYIKKSLQERWAAASLKRYLHKDEVSIP